MQVNNNLNSYNNYKAKLKSDNDFSDILAQMSASNASTNPLDSTQNFKENIMQYGIMATISIMNEERIQEQIDLKRAELLKALDVDNLSPKQKAQALASIEETLARYKKELKESNHDFKTESLEDSTLKKLFTLL